MLCAPSRPRAICPCMVSKGTPHRIRLATLSGSLPGEHGHGVRVAQTGPCVQGVPLMQRHRVSGADGRRDTALGVAAVAVVDAALGHHQHAAVLGGQQRGVQAGDAAPYDDAVIACLLCQFRIGDYAVSASGASPLV